MRNPVDVASGTTELRRLRPCPCSRGDQATAPSRYVYRADIELSPRETPPFLAEERGGSGGGGGGTHTEERSRSIRRVSAGAARRETSRSGRTKSASLTVTNVRRSSFPKDTPSGHAAAPPHAVSSV